MEHIRVVWKEKTSYNKKAFKYRGKEIVPYGNGWAFDGDENIYRTSENAMNAIDQALGGSGGRGASKRRNERGIQIIGKKPDSRTAAL